MPKDYPGGDLTAKFPIRALIGIMGKDLGIQQILDLDNDAKLAPRTYANHQTLSLLHDAQIRGINTMNSTSAGRFLDAASFVLGICSENSYDGECPMKLESMSSGFGPDIKPVYISSQGTMNLDTGESLKQLMNYKKQGENQRDLAYSVQWHLGNALAEIACIAAEENQIDYVGFSGGVALNRIITKAVVQHVISRGLRPLIHRRVPPGDGGVSLGQVLVAAWKYQIG